VTDFIDRHAVSYHIHNTKVVLVITSAPMANRSGPIELLANVASDLSSSLTSKDRYERLLQATRRIVPCDAACLMVLESNALVPLASYGLVQRAMLQRFEPSEHPRLARILETPEPIQFPADSSLPDPFDGLLVADTRALHGIHACLGAALHDGDQVVGALTADAIEPHAFDDLDPNLLRLLAGLAGAALRTARLIETLETTVDRQAQDLRDRAREVFQHGFLGTSLAARRVIEEVTMVASTNLPTLIIGETGVGKELVAAQLHASSNRRDQPLVTLNCAALPESLAESELFGHRRGAFTGATMDRAGKFELADRATLFLDEVGELPLTLQPKLLRALQAGEVQRVGADRVLRVDVRIIAATNRDLPAEVAAGRFRADLYHRLATYPIRVPPLRERIEDLPILVDHLLTQIHRRIGGPRPVLFADALELLGRYTWPGNVRELDNVLARSLLRANALQSTTASGAASGKLNSKLAPQRIEIHAQHIEPDLNLTLRSAPKTAPQSTTGDRSLAAQMDAFQRQVIVETVAAEGGNWAAAARVLGLHRANLHAMARRLGLK
jgi:anaerobic nitric oxide reductase transcription regulator